MKGSSKMKKFINKLVDFSEKIYYFAQGNGANLAGILVCTALIAYLLSILF